MTLDSGPLWPLVIAQIAPIWAGHVMDRHPMVDVTVEVGAGGPVITATPAGDKLAAAWTLTAAWAETAAHPMMDGVPVTVALPEVVAYTTGETLAGVAAGAGREWWAARAIITVGSAVG